MAFDCTVKQAAEKLGISETRVYQLIKEGLLPAEFIAGRYFIDDDAIQERLHANPAPGRPRKSTKGIPRLYTLMNREHEVFDFVFDDLSREFTAITEAKDLSRAPFGLVSPRGKKVSLSSLAYWWKHRSIPRSRQGMEEKLIALGLSEPSDIPFKSLGLSLSDQYWIRPHGMDMSWKDVNFFMNVFPDMETSDWLAEIGLESPNNTSEGQLSKRWIHRDGTPYLIKGSTALGQEPYNEMIASELHRRLLAPSDYVTYTMERANNGEIVSLCRDFLTDEEEFIPAYYVMKAKSKTGGHTDYQHYLECCSRLEVDKAEEALAKMIVTDDILANTDRHLRNFGLIRNVETLEFRVAPLFDTGTSLLVDKPQQAVMAGDLSFSTKPFSSDPNQQLRLVSDYSWFSVDALEGFVEKALEILRANPLLDQRLASIEALLKQRIERLAIISA